MTQHSQRCENGCTFNTRQEGYDEDDVFCTFLRGLTYIPQPARRVIGVRGCASYNNAQQRIDRKVITLCGSVKFWDEYKKWNAILTLQGNVVFSCGLSLKSGYWDLLSPYTAEQLELVKKDLDEIHLRKIDLSDGICVLNVGGYIGESTKREIVYAESKGKFVNYLEPSYVQEEQK